MVGFYRITLVDFGVKEDVLSYLEKYCVVLESCYIDSLQYLYVKIGNFQSDLESMPEKLFFKMLPETLFGKVTGCTECQSTEFSRQMNSFRSLGFHTHVPARRVPVPVRRYGFVLEKELEAFLCDNGFTPEMLDLDEKYANSRGDGDASGGFCLSMRNIIYPFSFSTSFKADFLCWETGVSESEVRSSMYRCSSCNAELSFDQVTLDHVTPLAVIFNDTDWKKPRENRKTTFFQMENLKIMCRSCNSRKGSTGVHYDLEKLRKMIMAGLI